MNCGDTHTNYITIKNCNSGTMIKQYWIKFPLSGIENTCQEFRARLFILSGKAEGERTSPGTKMINTI